MAQVKITEVMYDAPGSDSGREWVEIANLGSQNIDIGKYKLFENGTNHGLKAVQGTSMLAPNTAAIIAADPQKFLADYPGFAGALLDSAFSLSNTGETLVLKDASSTPLDTVSFAAVSDANGTGGSLNLKDNAFVAAMASPGIYPGPMTPVPKAAPAPAKASTKKAPSAASSKDSAAKGSAAASKPATASAQANADNTASLSFVPALSEPALIGLGLLAVALLGVAGVFFIRTGKPETSLPAEEFTIE